MRLQFALANEFCPVFHRPTSQVIHRLEYIVDTRHFAVLTTINILDTVRAVEVKDERAATT